MKPKKIPDAEQAFVDSVRRLEERMYPDQLEESAPARMKGHGKYSWLYRPSHHIETGLITEADIELLSQPARRLLSVGAYPASLEKILVELGVPAENMLIADVHPDVAQSAGPIPFALFDMTGPWPAIGDFDRVVFPESLCIAIGDSVRMKEVPRTAPHATDSVESGLLAEIMRQALVRLRPGGIIRANGPISHPSVVEAMSRNLRERGCAHAVEYRRFFLSMCR